MQGAKIEVKKFVSSKNRKVEKKNIYLKQFPESYGEEEIKKFISEKLQPLGKIESEGIYGKEINGKKKYFAFVAFAEKESADEAIERYNNIKLEDDSDDKLYVGIAESKKKRKEKFKKQHIPINQ